MIFIHDRNGLEYEGEIIKELSTEKVLVKYYYSDTEWTYRVILKSKIIG